jgi:hypothetical protein
MQNNDDNGNDGDNGSDDGDDDNKEGDDSDKENINDVSNLKLNNDNEKNHEIINNIDDGKHLNTMTGSFVGDFIPEYYDTLKMNLNQIGNR